MLNLINFYNTWIASFMRARFGRTERGASLVEYVLLVSLIAVVCIAAITVLGNSASDKFDTVGDSIAG
jgi:pilus assembly protein Flp/PilA